MLAKLGEAPIEIVEACYELTGPLCCPAFSEMVEYSVILHFRFLTQEEPFLKIRNDVVQPVHANLLAPPWTHANVLPNCYNSLIVVCFPIFKGGYPDCRKGGSAKLITRFCSIIRLIQCCQASQMQ